METVSVILGQIQLTVIIHIGKQVSANEPNTETWSASVPNEDEAHRVQAFLLNILTAGLQQSRYAVFENAIKEYHRNCFERVQNIIRNSNKPNKLQQLKNVRSLYEKHVKNYPKQNQQAILDGQTPEPIARNAGIATNALCHQMFGFTK